WFWRVRRVPDTPEGRYLMELLASNEFQEGLKNYRDLRFLSSNLDAWANSIATYRDILAVRRQAFAERLPRTIAGESTLHLERLRADYLAESQSLERIASEEDAGALADQKERALASRLERVRAGLAGVADPAERAAAQEK